MTITEFLEARIVEDEALARGACDASAAVPISQHVTRWDPARVLAECEAKRAVIAGRERIDRSANDDEWSMGYSDANYEALRALAAVYKDHPDYQDWAP